MKKLFIITLLFSVAFISLNAQTTAKNELPSITLKDLNGKSVNFANYGANGKITIVSFWATWCGPCKKELIKYNDMLPDWQAKYNVQMVAVSTDNSRNVAKVKPYVAGQRWKCDVLLDVNQDLQRAFNIASIPYSLIIKDGKVVYQHNGYVDGDEKELEEQLKKLAKN